jgi:hypothetical protein
VIFYAGLFGLMQLYLPNIGMRRRGSRRQCPGVASAPTVLQVAPRHPAFPSCGAGPLMPTEVDLRAAIESENAAIVELKTKIGEDPLRLLLQSALDTLSFVSKAFLAPTAMERMRTPAELDSWFAHATRRTGGAIAPRGRAGRDPPLRPFRARRPQPELPAARPRRPLTPQSRLVAPLPPLHSPTRLAA